VLLYAGGDDVALMEIAHRHAITRSQRLCRRRSRRSSKNNNLQGTTTSFVVIIGWRRLERFTNSRSQKIKAGVSHSRGRKKWTHPRLISRVPISKQF